MQPIDCRVHAPHPQHLGMNVQTKASTDNHNQDQQTITPGSPYLQVYQIILTFFSILLVATFSSKSTPYASMWRSTRDRNGPV
jgi:hypothetical protein